LFFYYLDLSKLLTAVILVEILIALHVAAAQHVAAQMQGIDFLQPPAEQALLVGLQ
jgi:hypothetical protein